jgi:hypothetical protein
MKIFGHADSSLGIWFVRVGRCLVVLRAPRFRPLFSERYGPWWNRIPLGFGWRIGFRRDAK